MDRLLTAALMVTALAAPALAGSGAAGTPAGQEGDGRTLDDVYTLARWAVVLAALALAGVLWVGWSMRALARNQVQLGQLIQSLKDQRKE